MRAEFTRRLTAALMARTIKRKPRGKKALERQIEDLIASAEDKEIMRRRFIDCMTYEEIADRFGYSVGGIVKKIYRRKKLLKV